MNLVGLVPTRLRLPYLRFANVVARAQREVLRDPEFAGVSTPVIAYSVDASIVDTDARTTLLPPWGEFWPPDGPIVIWQAAWEAMPDKENYYRQIKDVIRHELRHARGDRHPEDGVLLAHVGAVR